MKSRLLLVTSDEGLRDVVDRVSSRSGMTIKVTMPRAIKQVKGPFDFALIDEEIYPTQENPKQMEGLHSRLRGRWPAIKISPLGRGASPLGGRPGLPGGSNKVAHLRQMLWREIEKQQTFADASLRNLAILGEQGGEQGDWKSLLDDLHGLGFKRARIYQVSRDGKNMVGIGYSESSGGYRYYEHAYKRDQHMARWQETRQPLLSHRYQNTQIFGTDDNESGFWIILPIFLHDAVIGKLMIDHPGPDHPVDAQKLKLLQLLVTRSMEKVAARQQASDFEQLWSTTVEKWDADSLLDSILQRAVNLLGGHSGGIYRVDRNGTMTVVAEYQNKGLVGLSVPEGGNLAWHLVKQNLPYIIENNYHGWDYQVPEFEKKYMACVDVPLKRDGDIVGVMYVGRFDRRVEFTERDAWLLQSIAVQAEMALRGWRRLVRSDALDRLVNSCPNAIILTGRDRRVEIFNPRAQELLGYSTEEASSLEAPDFYADHNIARMIGGRIKNPPHIMRDIETDIVSQDGRKIPVRISVAQLEDGETVGYFEKRHDQVHTEFLAEASRIVARGVTLRDGLLELSRRMIQVAQVSFCHFCIFDDNDESFRLKGYDTSGRELADTKGTWLEYPSLSVLMVTEPRLYQRDREEERETLDWYAANLEFEERIRFLLVVPFVTRKGHMFLGITEERKVDRFDSRIIQLAEGIANETALLILRVRQDERLKAERKLIQETFEASNKLLLSKDPERVLEEVVKRLKGFGFLAIKLFLVDREGLPVRCIFASEHEDWGNPLHRMKEQGLPKRVVRGGEALVLHDLKNTSYSHHPFWNEIDVGAALCLPLKTKDRVTGVIWLLHKQPYFLEAVELSVLIMFGNHVALSYDHSRQLEKQNEVVQAQNKLAKIRTLDGVKKTIVGTAPKILEVAGCFIILYDLQNKELLRDTLSYKKKPKPGLIRRIHAEVQLKNQELKDLKNPSSILRHPFKDGLIYVLNVTEDLVAVLFLEIMPITSIFTGAETLSRAYLKSASMALTRVYLLDRLKRWRLAIKLILATEATKNIQATLKTVAGSVLKRFKCAQVTIQGYLTPKNKIVPPLIHAYERKVASQEVFDTDLTGTIKSFSEGALSERWIHKRNRSTVYLGLRYKTELVGVMILFYDKRHHLSQTDMDDLKMLAEHAALSIWNNRIMNSMKTRVEALQIVNDAARQVITSPELKETLSAVTRSAHAVRHRGRGSVHIWTVRQSRGQTLARPVASHPEPSESPEIELLPDGPMKVLSSCVQKGVTIYEPDINHPAGKTGNHSELAVPIKKKDEVIGAINFEHRQKDAFDESHILVVESLAALASLAIQSTNLYEELIKIKGYIGNQTAINWISMVSTTWGHEIKRETGIARTIVALLKISLEEVSSHEGLELLEQLDKALVRLKEIPILAPLTSDDKSGEVKVNELLRAHLEHAWEYSNFEDVTLTFDLEADLDKYSVVIASPNWLRRLFEIIVNNAVRALREMKKPDKTVTVTSGLNDGQIFVRIRDNGPGLPEAVQKKIFHERIEKKEGARGVGIGLMLAHTIAQANQGDLTWNREVTDGTELIISLPARSQEDV